MKLIININIKKVFMRLLHGDFVLEILFYEEENRFCEESKMTLLK